MGVGVFALHLCNLLFGTYSTTTAAGTSCAYEKHDGPPTISLSDYNVNTVQSPSYHDTNGSFNKSR